MLKICLSNSLRYSIFPHFYCGCLDRSTLQQKQKKKTKNADERKGVWNICLTLHFNSSARRRFAILFTHSKHTHTHKTHCCCCRRHHRLSTQPDTMFAVVVRFFLYIFKYVSFSCGVCECAKFHFSLNWCLSFCIWLIQSDGWAVLVVCCLLLLAKPQQNWLPLVMVTALLLLL